MGEYVDKQAVESIFRNARKAMKPENYKGDEFFIRDSILLNAEQIVHLMQAADVAPVRHGRWMWNPNGMDWGLGAWCCSECKSKAATWWANDKKHIPLRCSGGHFCGNCGAKMDGEEV